MRVLTRVCSPRGGGRYLWLDYTFGRKPVIFSPTRAVHWRQAATLEKAAPTPSIAPMMSNVADIVTDPSAVDNGFRASKARSASQPSAATAANAASDRRVAPP